MQQRTFAATLILGVLPLLAASRADDEPPPPPPPAVDLEARAAQLVEHARQLLEADRPQKAHKAYNVLKRVRADLGATRYVQEHREEIDAAFARAQDGVAAEALKQAEALADRKPEKARELVAQLRDELGGSRFVQESADAIAALETRLRGELWPGRGAYRGQVVLPADGVVRITYAFDSVEELADFELDAKYPPQVADGCLSCSAKADVLRQKLEVPAGAEFRLELRGRGYGKLELPLSGDGAELEKGEPYLEVDSSSRGLELSLGEEGRRPAEVAQAPRRRGLDASASWSVRIERTAGTLRASLTAAGGEVATCELADPGAAFRPGLSFRSSKLQLEELVVEAPLPGEPVASAEGGDVKARPPLPEGIWIPLVKSGLEGWQAKGRWTVEGQTIRQEQYPAWLTNEELADRALDAYTFTVDVRIGEADAIFHRRKNAEPYFAIVLPAGAKRFAWVLSARAMEIDGALTDAHDLRTLRPGDWQTLTVKLDDEALEVFLGATRIFEIPRAQLGEPRRRFADRQGLVFVGLRRTALIELREPRIKIDAQG